MSFLSDWLKVIQLKPRYLFGLCLLGIFILFMPSNLAESFAIARIRSSHKSWIGFSTLAFFVFWLVQLWPWLKEKQEGIQLRREALKALDTLSSDERFLLAYCLDRGQRTVCLEITYPAALALCQKSLLVKADEGNIMAWPHTIPSFIWDRLQKLKQQILSETEKQDPNYRRKFEYFENYERL